MDVRERWMGSRHRQGPGPILRFLAAAVAMLGVACCASAPEPDAEVSWEVRGALQRRSIENVHWTHGAPPPAPAAAERAALLARKERADAEELAELQGYVNDPELQLLAMRDSDGDGIHDYRVSDYYGRFLEGDVDVDGDGIRNTLDVAPYDPAVGGVDEDGDGAPDRGFGDRDADGVPDHVDWSGAVDDEVAGWQAELFRDHGVLLAARSAPFTPTLARSVRDALGRVFRGPLAAGRLPSMRLITTDETCLLSQELDDATNAMVVPQTQTLVVYRVGLDYEPIAQVGLLVHELGHVWQFALDFEADLQAENRRVFSANTKFFELLEPHGWSAVPVEGASTEGYSLFTPQYYTLGPDSLYHDETPDEWKEWVDAIYAEAGGDYLADERMEGIVGDYSLSSPFEWHSDNLLAYFYSTLEARVTKTLAPAEAAPLLKALREIVAATWPGFRYQNFDHERHGEHFRQAFPLTDADLDHFVDEYLRPAAAKRPAG